MNKVKAFVKKHKVVLVGIGSAALGFAVKCGLSMLDQKAKAKNMIHIEPDFYKTFDEAVDAFKELQKTTDHAVLFDSYGFNYGVFDESELLGEPKKK